MFARNYLSNYTDFILKTFRLIFPNIRIILEITVALILIHDCFHHIGYHYYTIPTFRHVDKLFLHTVFINAISGLRLFISGGENVDLVSSLCLCVSQDIVCTWKTCEIMNILYKENRKEKRQKLVPSYMLMCSSRGNLVPKAMAN